MSFEQNNIRWAHNLGARLIEKISITTGGQVISTIRICQKCGEQYSCMENDEDTKIIRENHNISSPNICLCLDCDKTKDLELEKLCEFYEQIDEKNLLVKIPEIPMNNTVKIRGTWANNWDDNHE